MNKTTFVLSMLALAASVFFFVWFNQWIIIIPSRQQLASQNLKSVTCKKKASLFLPKQQQLVEESKEIVYSVGQQNLFEVVAQAWLNQAYEEHLFKQPIHVQTAAISFNKDELIVSFDAIPLPSSDSVMQKLMLVEALIKTMSAACPYVQKIHFLCNHKPWADDQLDFSFPWPIEPFSTERVANVSQIEQPLLNNKIIVIHPFGDAKQTGRTVHNGFERTYTLEYATALKKYLEEHLPLVRVIISRSPGTCITQQQAAELANKLHADIYIELMCYATATNFFTCSFFYLSFRPEQSWQRERTAAHVSPLALVPIKDAHFAQTKNSKLLSRSLAHSIQKTLGNSLEIQAKGVGAPLIGLTGITCPACAIEIGIPKNDQSGVLKEELAKQLLALF